MSDDEVLAGLDWEYPPALTPEQELQHMAYEQAANDYFKDPVNVASFQIWLGNMMERKLKKNEEDRKWES